MTLSDIALTLIAVPAAVVASVAAFVLACWVVYWSGRLTFYAILFAAFALLIAVYIPFSFTGKTSK